MSSALLRFWRVAGSVALIAVGLSAAFYGPKGATGMLMGMAGSFINLWAFWMIIKLASNMFASEQRATLGASFIVFAFFAKLPIFFALWLLSRRVGDPAPSCFLIGLGLVYCGAVGWSLASR